MDQIEFVIISFLRSLGFSGELLSEDNNNISKLYKLTNNLYLRIVIKVDSMVSINWILAFSENNNSYERLLESLEKKLQERLKVNLLFHDFIMEDRPSKINGFTIGTVIAKTVIAYERARAMSLRISDAIDKSIDLSVDVLAKKCTTY